MAVRPSHGGWAPGEDPHTPPEAARQVPWTSPQEPGRWSKVARRVRDRHTETWWAADLTLASYGPGGYFRLVATTSDPATLPAASTWYLVTEPSALLPAADVVEVVRLNGLRQWVEQAYRQIKGALDPPTLWRRGSQVSRADRCTRRRVDAHRSPFYNQT